MWESGRQITIFFHCRLKLTYRRHVNWLEQIWINNFAELADNVSQVSMKSDGHKKNTKLERNAIVIKNNVIALDVSAHNN